jgi:hypothetical protein
MVAADAQLVSSLATAGVARLAVGVSLTRAGSSPNSTKRRYA